MHGIVQGSLSAFHSAGLGVKAHNLYMPLSDVLELRTGGCTCSFRIIGHTSRHDMIRAASSLRCVYIRDLISSVTIRSANTIPPWMDDTIGRDALGCVLDNGHLMILGLNKPRMGAWNITMGAIEAAIGTMSSTLTLLISPAMYACIYIYCRDYTIAYDARVTIGAKKIGAGTVSDIAIVGDRLVCSSTHLSTVLAHGGVDLPTLFCNDAIQVWEHMGVAMCREILLASLIEGNGIHPSDASLIVDYMTWDGRPRTFTKQQIEGVHGPLFDMYYERPKGTLTHWITTGDRDTLDNPYSQLMVGAQRYPFSIHGYK
jgi:hypothetical protein